MVRSAIARVAGVSHGSGFIALADVLTGSWTLSPRSIGSSASRPRLQAGNQQQIDNLDGAVRATDTDGPAGRRNCQGFRVLDRKYSSVGQMNIERLKWASTMHFLQLFDGHGRAFDTSLE